MPGLDYEPPAKLNLDEIFGFLHDKSTIEPITPFRLAVYMLIRVIAVEHKEEWLSQSQLTEFSFLIYALLAAVNLSFPEFRRAIAEPLNRICPGLFDHLLQRIDDYRGDVEVLIRRDELFYQTPPRRRRLTQAPRAQEDRNFITPKSVLGIFVRKIALAQRLHTVTQLRYHHEQWLKWLSDERPSAREDLFGGYSAFVSFNFGRPKSFCGLSNEAGALTPRLQNIHLNTAPIKDRSAFLCEELVKATVSAPKGDVEGEKRFTAADYRRNVFLCEKPQLNLTAGYSQNSRDPELSVQPPLYDLLSAHRARAFVDRQIHLLHVSPEEAMPYAQLKAACAFIKDHYHMPTVHLVVMLNAIRNCNVIEAEDSLREFFDWGAIRVNERGPSGDVRLTSCDARPLGYAPLLLARLARLFNQRERARLLLTEAIQHAHQNRDLVCLRLALVEQGAIEAEDEYGDASTTSEDISSPSLLLTMWAPERPEEAGSEENDDENEDYDNELQSSEEKDDRAFNRQLHDCATLQNCITMAKKCEDQQQIANGLQACVGADYGVDRESQSRLMNEAARAVVASLKLSSGFVDSAISDSEALLRFNLGDQWCMKYNTEAQVIAGVNIVYGHAINGRFQTAFSFLEQLKARFSLEHNQQCALHWKKCECLVEFDRAFLLGQWRTAEKWLEHMITLAPEEVDCRRAVYEFTRGGIRVAFDLARARSDKLTNSKDVRLKIRCEMVLAMFYACNNREHVGRRLLEQCLVLAKSHRIDNFPALITRRLAYIDAIEERFDDALEKIAECEWLVKTRCSPLEKAHLALTAYTAHKGRAKAQKDASETDSSTRLSLLVTARSYYRRASAPLLEKAVLKLAAHEYDQLGQTETRDDCAVAFLELQEQYPANLNWAIL